MPSFASTSLRFLTHVQLTSTDARFYPKRLMYSAHPEGGLAEVAAPSTSGGGYVCSRSCGLGAISGDGGQNCRQDMGVVNRKEGLKS